MNRAALMVCKTYLSLLPVDKQQALAGLLPPEEQETLYALAEPSSMEMNERLGWDLLEEIHPSWLAPYLRTLSEGDLRLFVAALSAHKRQPLERAIGFSNHLPHLTPVARGSLRAQLLKQVTHDHKLIPMGFLPENPLNRLLSLSEAKLEKLLRFLGLHDLAFEMRQIISTAILKKIFAALTKQEGEYLQSLLLHREPLVFERLFLDKWDESHPHMAKLLIERGAHRLGAALFSADESLVWYVTHRLEIHIAGIVLKAKKAHSHARAEVLLLGQIEKIIQLLSEGESK